MNYSKLNFALYARKSTEDDNKQVQSIPDQISEMTAKAKSLRITFKPKKDVFKEARSAKTPGKRDEFNRLITAIRAGQYNAIICWSTSRLARNPEESGIIQQLLEDGILLCIVTHEKTYYPEDNSIVFAVEMGMNSQYVRDLMVAVRRGMHSKAERGWFPHVPPMGYKNHTDEVTQFKSIIADPDRFDTVRMMWDMMLMGNYTVPEIARWAEKKGLRGIKRKKVVINQCQ